MINEHAHPFADFVLESRSLILRNLGVLNYYNGFTLWVYKATGATIDDVMRPGYFRDARGMLKPGDVLYVCAADGVANLYVTAGLELAPVHAGIITEDMF